MPRILRARVVTPTGARIHGEVANLTSTGMFLRTAERLRFGDTVTVRLFSHSIPGQVLFVSAEPSGVVLSLRPSDEARDVLRSAAADVEIIEPLEEQDPSAVNPWADKTLANLTGEEAPRIEPEAVTPGSDLEAVTPDAPVAEEDTATALDLALEELEMSYDFGPEATSDGTEDGVPPVADVPTGDDAFDTLDPALVAAALADDHGASSPARTGSGVHLPRIPVRPATLEELDTPPEEDTEAALQTDPDGSDLVAAAAVVKAAPMTAEGTLPHLDRDGFTVRFLSAAAYQVQYGANIEKGGLVVLSTPLPIGTQRMLALEVPGRPAYTVSARVIYHQEGKLGFMLDSFNVHKAKLARLAT